MARLDGDQKAFIVTRLACFDTPSQVVEAVREEFGITIDRRQVQMYDATRSGRKPAPEWCALFEATRKKFLEEMEDIPIAHRAVRLRRLERIYVRSDSRGNDVLAKDVVIEAERFCGGMYTNRRELTGANGGPIETRDASLDDMTDAELALLARELADSLGGDAPEDGA